MQTLPLVLVRGAGDLATGAIQALVRAGFPLLATEIERPTAIRRAVALSDAIYEGRVLVEDLLGVHCPDLATAQALWAMGPQSDLDVLLSRLDSLQLGVGRSILRHSPALPLIFPVPVFVDPRLNLLNEAQPTALIDATMAKRNLGLRPDMAPITIALGPGFSAGSDCQIVIETARGHELGRLIFDGPAAPNTGTPGLIGGESAKRVVHATAEGRIVHLKKIGDLVQEEELLAWIVREGQSPVPVKAALSGVLRGLIHDSYPVHQGMKIADIDPRAEAVGHCFTISDKSRALGNATLSALLYLLARRAG